MAISYLPPAECILHGKQDWEEKEISVVCSFWSSISLCFLQDLSYPSSFSLLRYIHSRGCLRLQNIMIFKCYYFRRGFNFYHSGRYILFMYFFKMTPFGFIKSCFFVKCQIPTNLYMMESSNVYPEVLGDFIVFNKYSLLSGRIQLGSLLFQNVYIYSTSKYLENRDNFRGEFQPSGLFFHVFVPKIDLPFCIF